MAWEKYAVQTIEPVTGAFDASVVLDNVLVGDVPVGAILDTEEYQFSPNDPRTKSRIEKAEFRIYPTKEYSVGTNGKIGLGLGLHPDGEPSTEPPQSVHVHRMRFGLALARFVPMRLYPGGFASEYIDRDTHEVDTRYYEPLVYEIETRPGMTLVFAVAGRTAVAHEFTSQPTVYDWREFGLTTLERPR